MNPKNTSKFIPEIIFEDNHCLAVLKPWNMLTQGDITGDPCLLDWARAWIKDSRGKPGDVYLGLLHRLDRPASGIVLFARTSKAASRLSDQFRKGLVDKEYLAIVHGDPGTGRELIHHLLKDPRKNIVRSVTAGVGGSKEAKLRFRLLGRQGNLSLVGVELMTGRPHQIRVQMSAIGCPIAGDLKYGASTPLPGRNIALFAYRLAFEHPTLKSRVQLKALPPIHEYPWQEFPVTSPEFVPK